MIDRKTNTDCQTSLNIISIFIYQTCYLYMSCWW